MKPKSHSKKETREKGSPSGPHEWVGGHPLPWSRGVSEESSLGPSSFPLKLITDVSPALSSSPGSSSVPRDQTGVSRKNRRVDTFSALMLFSS